MAGASAGVQSTNSNPPFFLDTFGSCLMCFDKLGESDIAARTERTSTVSFRLLARHLKVDIGSVLPPPPPPPPPHHHQSFTTTDHDVCAPLCVKCARLTGTFLDWYEEWELMRIQVDTFVRKIERVMVAANSKCDDKFRAVRAFSKFDPSMAAGFRIVDNFRKELLRKCAAQAGFPKIKLTRVIEIKEEEEEEGEKNDDSEEDDIMEVEEDQSQSHDIKLFSLVNNNSTTTLPSSSSQTTCPLVATPPDVKKLLVREETPQPPRDNGNSIAPPRPQQKPPQQIVCRDVKVLVRKWSPPPESKFRVAPPPVPPPPPRRRSTRACVIISPKKENLLPNPEFKPKLASKVPNPHHQNEDARRRNGGSSGGGRNGKCTELLRIRVENGVTFTQASTSSPKWWECGSCSEVVYFNKVKKHGLLVHADDEKPQPAPATPPPPTNHKNLKKAKPTITPKSTSKPDYNFKCQHCPDSFRFASGIWNHTHLHHRDILLAEYKHDKISTATFRLLINQLLDEFRVTKNVSHAFNCPLCSRINCSVKGKVYNHMIAAHKEQLGSKLVSLQNKAIKRGQ